MISLSFVTLIAAWGAPEAPYPAWSTPTAEIFFADPHPDDSVRPTVVKVQIRNAQSDTLVLQKEIHNPEDMLIPFEEHTTEVYWIGVHEMLGALPNGHTYYARCLVVYDTGEETGWTDLMYIYKNWVDMPKPGINELRR